MPTYLTAKQAAAILGVTTRTMQRWRKINKGPKSYKVCGSIRYLESDIHAWVQQ